MGSSPLFPLLHRAFSASTATPLTTQSTGVVKDLSDDLYRTRDPKKLVEKFLESSENERFRRKTGIYEEVVRRLSIAGRHSSVKKILDGQKKYSDITREGFCARLITLYGRSGMLGDAIKMFDEMPKLKSERTVMSVNAVLAACVNSKKFGKVEGFFRDLPVKVGVEPDIVSYNTVIKAFVEMGQLEKAVSMLEEMEKKGCEPDQFTFNTLLHGLFGREKFADGEKIWDKMLKSGVTPDVRSYNAKLTGFASEGKVQQALDLVEEMKQKGLSSDMFTYNLMIKACCNEGNLVEAKKWYGEMRSESKPDKRTYATLLPFVCEKGDLDLALGLCKNVFRDRCLVDSAVLQRVVDVLVQGSKLKEAKEILELANSNKYCNYKLKLPLVA